MNCHNNPSDSSVVSEEIFTVNLRAEHFDNFWSKVDKNGPSGCWNWTACANKRGYGSITINYVMLRANRVSYFMANGPFLKSLMVCHTCDNPRCVNPAHLFLGTCTVNVHDMVQKGRGRWGSTMNMEKANQIRALYAAGGITMQKLADQFDSCLASICFIINYKSWIPTKPWMATKS